MNTVTLLPKQKQGMQSAKKEVILSGAFGSGKSRWLCYKILYLLTKYPRNRGFLCRKTLQSLKTTTLKTLLDGDGSQPAVLPKEFIASHNKQDRVITLVNGSELWYGNMDKEFIKSMNLGFAAVDELSELTEEDWNFLSGRLRLAGIPVTQLIAATNPASKQHWIWNRAKVNVPKDDEGQPKVEFISSSTLDNHFLPKEYIENLKQILFGYYYQRYVMGEWVGTDEIVYDNFDINKHVVKPFDIPRHWKLYRSFDFGYRAPFFCGWFSEAGEDAHEYGDYKKGDIFLYRELYYTQRTASVNADQVLKFSKYPNGDKEKYVWNVADWDSGDRADLESKGIYTQKANKDITFGVQKVRERLGNIDPTKGSLVRPRFYIFNNSLIEEDIKIRFDLDSGSSNNNPVRAREEFQVYSWKPDKEEPLDEYNHAMDAIRYFIMQLDGSFTWADIPFMKV